MEKGKELRAEVKEKVLRRSKLYQMAEENNFYSKMAVKMAEHVGLLVLTKSTLENARRKGCAVEISEALFAAASILFTLDQAEVLIHEIKTF